VNPGTYKSTDAVQVLIWDPKMADSYADEYRAALAGKPMPIRFPIPIVLKPNVEFTVEYGTKKPLIADIGEQKVTINAVDVTVTAGSKVYKGITLVYNDHLPTVVTPVDAVRPVKKRK
jgi:hypothetical protein